MAKLTLVALALILAPASALQAFTKPAYGYTGGGGRKSSPLGTAGPELHANPCDAKNPGQQWDLDAAAGHIVQRGTNDPQLCIDIDNYATGDESPLQVYACHPEDTTPGHQNQGFAYNATSKEIVATSDAKGMRVDLSNYGQGGAGSPVWIYHATGADNQQWSYDATAGQFRSLSSQIPGSAALCLDASVYVPPRACDVAPGRSQPWCDTSLSFAARVADLVSRIQPTEVVGLFSNGASGVPSLNIPAYQWWSEALHGVGHSPGVQFTGTTPYATSFPQVILTSSSLNKTLFRAIGEVISTEARAFNNQGHAGNTFWAPNINIFRDPRWGRGQETQGEDPKINGDYASNFPRGMQEGESWPTYIKASSCLKHYSAYNLEAADGFTRHNFNAVVSAQDLEDTYFPAFRAGVAVGNASGLMCSYNAVNGVPSCADPKLLQGQVRGAWGFDGYITSDCGAVTDVYAQHKYLGDKSKVAKAVLEAGMDSDCGGFLGANMQAAIDAGVVTKSDFNSALTNMFMVRMRLGHFDPKESQPYLSYGVDRINTPAHQQLALEAARQGITLLKNEGSTLPLRKGDVKTVAVLGPTADNGGVMQGNYQGEAPFLITPKAAIAERASVTYVQGCASVADTTCADTGKAAAAAAAADATVLVVGLDGGQEGEGHDRTSIALPGAQEKLIEAVAEAAKAPITLVVQSGGAVDISAAKVNPKVGAIVWIGYPGQAGGTALAEILFGDVVPSGRLTQTWYPAAYTTQCSMLDMNMRPNATTGCPGRSYRFYTGDAVYKFGDGLSYTSFATDVKVDLEGVSDTGRASASKAALEAQMAGAMEHEAPTVATATATVTNTGRVAADRTVMLFAVPPTPGRGGAPLKTLVGYERVAALAPGASTTITVPITAYSLSHADEAGRRISVAGDWTLVADGAKTTFRVV